MISYQVFIDFVEEQGPDLTEEDRQGILAAEKDIVEANAEAFVSLEDLRIYITDIVTRGGIYG